MSYIGSNKLSGIYFNGDKIIKAYYNGDCVFNTEEDNYILLYDTDTVRTVFSNLCSAPTSVIMDDDTGLDTSTMSCIGVDQDGNEGAWAYCEDTTLHIYSNGNYVYLNDSTSDSGLFNGYTKSVSIDLHNLKTDKVTKMGNMFSNCTSLTTIDVSNFDTSNVTSMTNMFSNCTSLTTLDVSNFDTSNAINMGNMFYKCPLLTSLDVSNFNTSNVTIMGGMFRLCSALTTIYASDKFDVSKVTSSAYMFTGDTKLKGAISYNSSKVDHNYANYTTGYFTYKAA